MNLNLTRIKEGFFFKSNFHLSRGILIQSSLFLAVHTALDLKLGSAESQEDEGGEKDDEGDVEDEVGEPEGPDALPFQPQETGDDGVLQQGPVLLGRHREVPQRLRLRQSPRRRVVVRGELFSLKQI